VGGYLLQLKAHADEITDATTPFQLTVVQPPSFDLTVSTPTLTIARGGIARTNVQIARTNFPSPLTLTLEGAAGVTALVDANPVVAGAATLTVAVGAAVPPGSYSVVLRGTAAGLADRTVPLTIIVTAAPLQVLVPARLATFQGGSLTEDLIINRAGDAGPVSLVADGLPAGISALFQPNPTLSGATMVLVVDPNVAAGAYPTTLRGTGQSGSVSSPFTVDVAPSDVSLSLSPERVTVNQGTSTTSTLSLARVALSADVAIAVEGAPGGVTATVQPSIVTGTSAVVTISASSAAIAGQYNLTVRARPQGWPASASRQATIVLTVAPVVAGGSGNVLVDWSGCATPDWVAGQDGTGAWAQLVGVAGKYRFDVKAGTGAFAYVEGGSSVVVRYMTQAELTAAPISMCVPVAPTRTMSGVGVHTTAPPEVYYYSLGGGSATSTLAAPSFSIAGVRDGVHDLVAWSPVTAQGQRGLIRRDVDVVNEPTLGSVSLIGSESFASARATLTVAGFTGQETLAHTMGYLTTSACTANFLYAGGLSGAVFIFGVPDSLRRASDFHQLIISATQGLTRRTTTVTFQQLTNRNVIFPAAVSLSALNTLPAGYKRLEVTVGPVAAEYNGATTLRYSAFSRSMQVSATSGYTGSATFGVGIPDFGGVSGWSNDYGVPLDAQGSWSIVLDGASSAGSACVQNRRAVTYTRTGAF
jgi:hypothetical protein